jgi:uncharacterized protein (TIGR00369 family)
LRFDLCGKRDDRYAQFFKVYQMSLEIGNQILHSQPFSQLLGVECTALEAGKVELRVAITERLTQQNGFVHGGVVGYMADNALGIAAGAKASKPVLTSEYKINFVRPAVGEVLISRAEVLNAGKTQHVVQAKVYALKGQEEKLCAIAQGTIMIMDTK